MDADEVFADIQAQFETRCAAGEFDAKLDTFMESQVVPAWRSNSPQVTDEYHDSVKVTKRASGGKGQVGATDEAANIVEYGNEKTPEYGPRAKTELHFNHSADVGIEAL